MVEIGHRVELWRVQVVIVHGRARGEDTKTHPASNLTGGGGSVGAIWAGVCVIGEAPRDCQFLQTRDEASELQIPQVGRVLRSLRTGARVILTKKADFYESCWMR